MLILALSAPRVRLSTGTESDAAFFLKSKSLQDLQGETTAWMNEVNMHSRELLWANWAQVSGENLIKRAELYSDGPKKSMKNNIRLQLFGPSPLVQPLRHRSLAIKSTKGAKEKPLRLLCFFVADQRLWRDAEDAPQTIVELEGRLRSVEVITRDLTRSTGAVHWNDFHVI